MWQHLQMNRILELKHKLTECERQRIEHVSVTRSKVKQHFPQATNSCLQIRAVLRKYCHLLEKISFMLPPEVHRLIHSIATVTSDL